MGWSLHIDMYMPCSLSLKKLHYAVKNEEGGIEVWLLASATFASSRKYTSVPPATWFLLSTGDPIEMKIQAERKNRLWWRCGRHCLKRTFNRSKPHLFGTAKVLLVVLRQTRLLSCIAFLSLDIWLVARAADKCDKVCLSMRSIGGWTELRIDGPDALKELKWYIRVDPR